MRGGDAPPSPEECKAAAMTVDIEVTTAPADEDARTLSEGISAFNARTIPDLEAPEDEVKFSVFARDDAGQVVGGIRAVCYWNMLHIELLWIDEMQRGKGLGRRVIDTAEAFALSKGYRQALLFTNSWQARPFYEKCGYTAQATIADYPEGHEAYLMTKTLSAP